MKPNPPRKQRGQARGGRQIAGTALDIKATAAYLGCTEHTVRARIERRLLPFHRWGGRVICVRSELDEFLRRLEGISVDEAVRNLTVRRGQELQM